MECDWKGYTAEKTGTSLSAVGYRVGVVRVVATGAEGTAVPGVDYGTQPEDNG